MSYQALYRVWRPQRFADIAGQEAVTRTLKNGLIQQKTSHAYLFTGPRGTGKTSAAKIFAKAINCRRPVEGEPCNECDICRAITEGRLNDVIEIDAASNNGVEEIRDIRDKARYAPTQADYKVYIIDEVHMLSTGAFNALLKTLEEPPENVIFILATTEPHKIPLTIISRTQRFDFRRINDRDILDRMQYILQEEKISYEEKALEVIARAANGGMRDALSLLDQVISYDAEKVTFEHAVKVSGSLTEEMMITYAESLWKADTRAGLEMLQRILKEGKEAGRFLEEMILFSRDVLVYQQTDGKAFEGELLLYTERFRSFSAEIRAAFLYEMIEAFNQTQNEMRFSTQPEVYLEVVTVKLCQAASRLRQSSSSPAGSEAPETVPQAAAATIAQLENELATMRQQLKKLTQAWENGSSKPEAAPKEPRKEAVRPGNSTYKPNMGLLYQVMEQATKADLTRITDVWGDILNVLPVSQRAKLRQAKPAAASGSSFILSFQLEFLCQLAMEDKELQEAVQTAAERMLHKPVQMVCITEEQWLAVRRSFLQNRRQPAAPVQPAAEKVQPSAPEESAQPANGYDPDLLENVMPPEDSLGFEAVEAEAEEQSEQEVVDQAISLFGEEIITIVND